MKSIVRLSFLIQLIFRLHMNCEAQKRYHPLINLHKGDTSFHLSDTDFLFITKQQIANYRLNEIKNILAPCTGSDSSNKACRYYIRYIFSNGRLSSEISFDDYKTNNTDAENLSYKYYYKLTKSKILLRVRSGDAYNGDSHEDHLLLYKYYGNKLMSEIYIEGVSPMFKERTASPLQNHITHIDTTFFFYNKNGILDYQKNIGNGSNVVLKYYIHNPHGRVIGYFPAKDAAELKIDSSDNIYSYESLVKIQRTGFSKFASNLPMGVYNKIINDCYANVKNNDLLVNGAPIKTFLKKIGAREKKYIVFEIAENYFIFFKLID